MAFPPLVPGLTETAAAPPTEALSALALLLGGRGGQNRPPTGMQMVKDAIRTLRQAAATDARLEDRVRQAIDALEGEDGDTSLVGAAASPKQGPQLMPDMNTPI